MAGIGQQVFYAGLDEALPDQPTKWQPAPRSRPDMLAWFVCLVLGFAGARWLDKWAGEIL